MQLEEHYVLLGGAAFVASQVEITGHAAGLINLSFICSSPLSAPTQRTKTFMPIDYYWFGSRERQS